MRALLAPEALAGRVREFVAAEAAGTRLDVRVQPLLEQAVLFGMVPRGDVPGLVGVSERQARRLVRPLTDRGLLTGVKDVPLRIAFPLGESERLFPHLWEPAGVTMSLDLPPEVEDALRSPRAAWWPRSRPVKSCALGYDAPSGGRHRAQRHDEPRAIRTPDGR